MKIVLLGVDLSIKDLPSDENISYEKLDSIAVAADYLQSNSVDIIVCDYNLSDGIADKLFQIVLKEFQNIIFIWYTKESEDLVCDDNFTKNHSLNRFVSAKSGLDDLISTIKDSILAVEHRESDQYASIGIEKFKFLNSVPCDIYIKLSDVKFVKIINENEFFKVEVIRKYQEKQINELFIKKEKFKMFSDYMFDVLKSSEDNSEKIFDEVNIEKETISFVQDSVKALNIDQKTIEVLDDVSKESIKNIKNNKHLGEFISNLIKQEDYLYGHSIMVSYISCILAMKMDLKSEVTLQKLSLSAILHDVVLDNEAMARVVDLESDEFKNLNWKDQEKIKKHPQESSKLLNNMKDVLPDVGNIILNHHENPLGTGFPRGLSAQRISQIAALFVL